MPNKKAPKGKLDKLNYIIDFLISKGWRYYIESPDGRDRSLSIIYSEPTISDKEDQSLMLDYEYEPEKFHISARDLSGEIYAAYSFNDSDKLEEIIRIATDMGVI